MAGSVNKVILVGNLGRDPEVRYTQSNQKIVHLAIATSERWKDRQSGEQREETTFVDVEAGNPRRCTLVDPRRGRRRIPARGAGNRDFPGK